MQNLVKFWNSAEKSIRHRCVMPHSLQKQWTILRFYPQTFKSNHLKMRSVFTNNLTLNTNKSQTHGFSKVARLSKNLTAMLSFNFKFRRRGKFSLHFKCSLGIQFHYWECRSPGDKSTVHLIGAGSTWGQRTYPEIGNISDRVRDSRNRNCFLWLGYR